MLKQTICGNLLAFSVAFDLKILSELQLNTHQIISKQYECKRME